jgi:hypothetical protein
MHSDRISVRIRVRPTNISMFYELLSMVQITRQNGDFTELGGPPRASILVRVCINAQIESSIKRNTYASQLTLTEFSFQ